MSLLVTNSLCFSVCDDDNNNDDYEAGEDHGCSDDGSPESLRSNSKVADVKNAVSLCVGGWRSRRSKFIIILC